jgi:hypothetical protein
VTVLFVTLGETGSAQPNKATKFDMSSVMTTEQLESIVGECEAKLGNLLHNLRYVPGVHGEAHYQLSISCASQDDGKRRRRAAEVWIDPGL